MSIIYTDQQKAEAVLVYRFTYGLSLDECAKQLGITSSALCHWNEEFEEIAVAAIKENEQIRKELNDTKIALEAFKEVVGILGKH